MQVEVIFLDRDGVLNEVVVDPEHGTIDSPLHPDQVKLLPSVPEALLKLSTMGFTLAVVTNQPSAAKQKTTRKNLEEVHAKVLSLAEAAGAKIRTSQICFHRSEDKCDCRKPKTGLFEAALSDLGDVNRASSWMVGDGVTDVEAGTRFGLRTAFLGPRKCDACKIFVEQTLEPTLWCKSLLDFTNQLEITLNRRT